MLLIIIHETDERGRSRDRCSAYSLPSQINDRLDLVTGCWDLSPGGKEGKCSSESGGLELSLIAMDRAVALEHTTPLAGDHR